MRYQLAYGLSLCANLARFAASPRRFAPILTILLLPMLFAMSDRAAAQTTTSSTCGQAAFTSGSVSCSGTLSNGDSFTLTVSAGGLSFVATGPAPFSVTISGIAVDGSIITFSGTESINGTSPISFTCTVNTSTGTSSGCGAFGSVFFFGAGGSVNPVVAAAVAGAAHGTTRSQVQGTLALLSDRIQSISRDIARSRGGGSNSSSSSSENDLRLNYSGLSAGSEDMKWGVWFDGSGSYLSNSSTTAAYEGYGATGLGGVDYLYDNTWLFGFDLGYARTDISVNAIMGNRTADAAQGGPYVSYIFSEHFTADATVVYAHVLNAVNAVTGNSSFDSNRVTTALNFNAFANATDNILLTGFVGWAYAYESPNSGATSSVGGTPTTIHYSAFRSGGEVACDIGDFEPYIPLTLSYETTETRDGTGRFGVDVGLGARYKWNDRLKIGVQATTEQRSHGETAVGSFNLRFVF